MKGGALALANQFMSNEERERFLLAHGDGPTTARASMSRASRASETGSPMAIVTSARPVAPSQQSRVARGPVEPAKPIAKPKVPAPVAAKTSAPTRHEPRKDDVKNKIEDRLTKLEIDAERNALLATRPDFGSELLSALRTAPLAVVREAIKVAHVHAESDVVSSAEREEIRCQMRGDASANTNPSGRAVKMHGAKMEFLPMTVGQAKARLKEIERAKGARS